VLGALAALQRAAFGLLPALGVMSVQRMGILVLPRGDVPPDFAFITISLAEIVAMLLLVVSGLRAGIDPAYGLRLRRTCRAIVRRRGGLWLCLLAVWLFLTTLWARERGLAFAGALQFAVILGMAFVLADAFIHEGEGVWRTALIGLLGGAALQAVIAIFQVIHQNPLGLGAFGEIERFWYEPTSYYRAPGLAMHPNYLAGYLLLALFGCALCGVLWRRGRWIAIGVAVLCLVGILCTASRGALLGLVLSAAPALFVGIRALPSRWRVRVVGGVVAVAALAALGLLVVVLRGDLANVTNRLFTPREFFWDDTFSVIRTQPNAFWVGVGENNLMVYIADLYPDEVRPLLPVHNVYVYQVATVGIVGAGLFALALLRMLRGLTAGDGLALFVWTGAILAMIVTSLVDNYFWAIPPFRLVALWAIGMWWGLSLIRKNDL